MKKRNKKISCLKPQFFLEFSTKSLFVGFFTRAKAFCFEKRKKKDRFVENLASFFLDNIDLVHFRFFSEILKNVYILYYFLTAYIVT